MKFQTTIVDVIKKRYSVRSYNGNDLDEELKDKLIKSLNEDLKTPFGNKVRFKLVESKNDKNQKIGTYGTISGTNYFIAGTVEKGEREIEDFGYAMESVILYTTELGLGTCWLGGSLNRSQFAGLMDLKENEIIPAVTPVGNISEKSNLKDKLFNIVIKPRARKDWGEIFFNNDFNTPLEIDESDIYKYPLEMLRLAPSASNKQPWRILKKDNGYHFYLERTKSYQGMLKMIGYDLQRVDIGIAMSHFELTANELNLEGKWQVKKPDNVNVTSDKEYIASWIIKK